MIGKVARKGGLKGLKKAARVAMGGQRILKNVPYSLHMTFDGHTESVAAEHMDLGADICAEIRSLGNGDTSATAFLAGSSVT